MTQRDQTLANMHIHHPVMYIILNIYHTCMYLQTPIKVTEITVCDIAAVSNQLSTNLVPPYPQTSGYDLGGFCTHIQPFKLLDNFIFLDFFSCQSSKQITKAELQFGVLRQRERLCKLLIVKAFFVTNITNDSVSKLCARVQC